MLEIGLKLFSKLLQTCYCASSTYKNALAATHKNATTTTVTKRSYTVRSQYIAFFV